MSTIKAIGIVVKPIDSSLKKLFIPLDSLASFMNDCGYFHIGRDYYEPLYIIHENGRESYVSYWWRQTPEGEAYEWNFSYLSGSLKARVTSDGAVNRW